ncbi:MAG: VWA domain-containing protein [Rhodobacterales bacterium]|nr:VWA domain-containing protein [Rhodobacterales bacterium]
MKSHIVERVLLPAAVTLLALLSAFGIGTTRQRPVNDALVVIDITRSMNVRDMDGVARLDYTKQAMLDWITARPCGSRIGLGLFTERRSVTLFEPIEVCANFSAIKGSLMGLDWRMAWDGDSMISKGLDYALARAEDLGVSLIFITDGQEAPPLPFASAQKPGQSSPGGLILGVGGDTSAPIPKYDDLGRETGFYGAEDVQHVPTRKSHSPSGGLDSSADADGEESASEHLSSLRASYLQRLAEDRGLGFLRLAAGRAAIDRALAQNAPTRMVTAARSLSPFLAGAALIMLLFLWATNLRARPVSERR